MIGIAFIIFAALIGISQGFVEVGGLLVPQLITDMPTFFDYDDVTGDMILDGDGNRILERVSVRVAYHVEFDGSIDGSIETNGIIGTE